MSKIFSIIDEDFFEADKSKETEKHEERDVSCISSISLIDDCISSIVESREKQKYPCLLSREIDSFTNDEDSNTALINADLSRSHARTHLPCDDILIKAARSRLEREKMKRRQKFTKDKNGKKQHVDGPFIHSKYTSAKVQNAIKRKVEVKGDYHRSKGNAISLRLSKEEKQEFSSDEEDYIVVKEKEQKSNDGHYNIDEKKSSRAEEGIAFNCMRSFIRDINKINKQYQSGSLQKDDLKDLVRSLEETYIHKCLDKLDGKNKTVTKVKRLIHTFSTKCSNPLMDFEKVLSIVHGKDTRSNNDLKAIRLAKKIKTYTWDCVICEKKGQSMQSTKCSVCGNTRGYKASHLYKNNSLGEHITIENDLRRNGCNNSDVDLVKPSPCNKRRVHFLQRKADYEISERSKFANEIGNVISSLSSLSGAT